MKTALLLSILFSIFISITGCSDVPLNSEELSLSSSKAESSDGEYSSESSEEFSNSESSVEDSSSENQSNDSSSSSDEGGGSNPISSESGNLSEVGEDSGNESSSIGSESSSGNDIVGTSSIEIVPIIPNAPTGLNLTVNGEQSITATWVDNSDNESGFNICWAKESESKATAPSHTVVAGVESYEITGLSAGTEYTIWISAIKLDQESNVVEASAKTEETVNASEKIRAQSLNIYGWNAIDQQNKQGEFADIIIAGNIDVVGLQESADDNFGAGLPPNYDRVTKIMSELSSKDPGCWENRYSILINTCRNNSFISNARVDMTDGQYSRTGEHAVISKNGFEYAFITVHWDFADNVQKANAAETAAMANLHQDKPVILVGDFNTACRGGTVGIVLSTANMDLWGVANGMGEIDCVIARGMTGTEEKVSVPPSDHDSVISELTPN